MKYYIYISDAKVDMLLPQVPHEASKKTAWEVKTDVKVFSASRKVERETEENRVTRLETVVDYLKSDGHVGPIDSTDAYIEGTVPMNWGPYAGTGDQAVVYFGGKSGTTSIGLGGSMRHVVGNVGVACPFTGSLTPFIVKALISELRMDQPELHPSLASRPDVRTLPFAALLLANKNMLMDWTGPPQRMEFVAKRLLDSSVDLNPEEQSAVLDGAGRVILASPLYVALVD